MNVKILLIIFLSCLATIVTANRFKSAIGIDFYQYWGVGAAQKLSSTLPKNPYRAQDSYAKVLNAHVDHSDDLSIKKANKQRRKLQLLQTPLCFLLFTSFTKQFSVAFDIYHVIQTILFLSAIVILSIVFYDKLLNLLIIALSLFIVFFPTNSDLYFGNLNCLYLFGFAVLLVLADRLPAKNSPHPVVGAGVFITILVFLTLLKPNWLPVTLLLLAYLYLTRGLAVFARASTAGVAFGAVFWVLPCLRFDSWMVWQDWYRYSRTWDSASLVARVSEGNYSLVLLISQIFKVSVASAAIISAASLIASILLALIIAVRGKPLIRGISQGAIHSLRDPHLVMATGIIATLGLSPLVWFHYYTVALIPALWLLSNRHPWGYARLAGWISIILISNIPGMVIRTFSRWASYQISWVTIAGGLLPLWTGVLAAIFITTKSLSEEG